jgi:hypothetical protein
MDCRVKPGNDECGLVSRRRCSTKRCFAEPGPLRIPSLVRPRLCSAPRREERRAALRPGNGKTFSFINIKFFKSPGDSYPPLPDRSYDRRLLSSEGALLEAILKWDRARADWCGATRTGRCGARKRASQARSREALGFRPARKGLPLCAGWTGTGERREIARSQVPGRADQGP